MTDLQLFKSETFGEVMVLLIDDEIWFVGRDVVSALRYEVTKTTSYTKYINQYCDSSDTKKVNNSTAELFGIKNAGRKGEVLINEYALYDLVMESPLPQAKEFKKWVTHEVLPTIRKTGGYINKNATPEQLKKLKDNIIVLEEKNAKLEYKIATHLISTKQVSLLGSIINYRAGLAGAARADLVKKDMVRELRDKFNIKAYGDLQEYQFNDAMNFINHYPVTPDNTKVTRLANFGK